MASTRVAVRLDMIVILGHSKMSFELDSLLLENEDDVAIIS